MNGDGSGSECHDQYPEIEAAISGFAIPRSPRALAGGAVTVLSEVMELEKKNTVLLEGAGHFYQHALPQVISNIQAFIGDLVT